MYFVWFDFVVMFKGDVYKDFISICIILRMIFIIIRYIDLLIYVYI